MTVAFTKKGAFRSKVRTHILNRGSTPHCREAPLHSIMLGILIGERIAQFFGMYSGTSDKGPFEIWTTSLKRTLVLTPCAIRPPRLR